jgi:serine/threonine protein kinase/TPR repeat protein
MNIQNLCLNCFAERPADSPCEHCGWRGKSAPEVDGQLRPGSVLHDRYVVGQPLGRGGFSITYRGWDTRLQRLRAIKEYFPAGVVTREGSQSRVSIVSGQSGLYSNGIQKYLAEARVLARFEGHPCIVFPTDFFEENSTAYLVMEYLQGETLRQYVTRHGDRIPYEHAVYYLTPVLRALATVHQAGMLHRDVSPDNVFLTVDSETKLLDFGAARQRMGDQSAAMTVIIRDHYAPPEQYSETGKQGSWTDIYAFAATFYYALTGESPPSALARLMNDEIKRPSELGVRMPAGAEAMLMRALAIQPRDRPQRTEEVLHALLAPPQPIVARAEPAPPEPAPPPVAPVAAPDPPLTEVRVEPIAALEVAPREIAAEDPLPTLSPPPVESMPVEPEPHVAAQPRPSDAREGARERVHAPPSFFRSLLDTALEERWWRWPVFALIALPVAFASYWLLEWSSPSRRVDHPSVTATTPADDLPPVDASDPPPPDVASPALTPAPAPQDPPPAPTPAPVVAFVPPEPAAVPIADPVANPSEAPAAAPAPEERPPLPAAGETPPGLAPGTAAPAPVPAAPKPSPKPPPPPIAKPAVPPTTEPSTKPAAARPTDEYVGVYREGRELVRSKERKDRKRGYELIAYAAGGGFPDAELLLGSLYVDGIPGIQKPDDASALKWYRSAAKHGQREARFDLARRLELGMWEKKVEYAEECAWWVPFCKTDLPQVQVRVAVDPEKDLLAYLRSQSPAKGNTAELKEALALYKGLAQEGDTDAQERIGYMLVAGNGLEANRFEAFLWFLKAARKGDVSAQYVVGKMYSKGEGFAPNDDAAVCWLRKAAAGNVAEARRALVNLGKAKPTGDLDPAPSECRFKPFDE